MKAIKTREVVRFLEVQGWSIKRQNGRHDVWGSPDGKQVFPLARHKECSPGVIRQIDKIFPKIPDNWK